MQLPETESPVQNISTHPSLEPRADTVPSMKRPSRVTFRFSARLLFSGNSNTYWKWGSFCETPGQPSLVAGEPDEPFLWLHDNVVIE
jgi:hypothetical protein